MASVFLTHYAHFLPWQAMVIITKEIFIFLFHNKEIKV